MTLTYHTGSELGPAQLTLTADDETVDLSAGYTFSIDIVDPAGQVVETITTGITGAAEPPNLTVAWAADALDLPPGRYLLQIQARSTGNLDWRWTVPLVLLRWT